MKDKGKTKRQLLHELARLRLKLAELEALEREHKNVEEELRGDKKLYEMLLNNVNDAVFVYQPTEKSITGSLIEVNDVAFQRYGYTREEFSGLTPLDLSIPEDWGNVSSSIKKLRDKRHIRFETVHSTKDGRKIPVVMNYHLLDHRAQPIVLSVARDVTDYKQAKEALKKIEEKYQNILESIEEGYFELDLAGNLTFFNESLYKIFGCPKDELLGMNIREFTDQETAIKGYQTFNRVYTTGKHIKEFYWDILRKDGTKRNGETSVSLINDVTGRKIGFRGSVKDITERRWAEEELRRSREQLRSLSTHLQSMMETERTLIAREIHDELGQALTALRMDISWLEKRLPHDQTLLFEKTKSMAEIIHNSIKTVQRISIELRPGMLDDLGLAAAMEWQAEEFQNRTGITCELAFDPEDIILDQDRSTAIFRIFQETLTNVARHAKATRAKISLKEKMDELVLKVRDNGKGIAEKQISSPKSFGLMGMRERASHLGGLFKINGVPGKGTTVEVKIPAGNCQATDCN